MDESDAPMFAVAVSIALGLLIGASVISWRNFRRRRANRTMCLRAASERLDVEIDYTDASGDRTHRRVTARSYDSKRDVLFGYCHMRRATRHFRADRMRAIALIDLSDERKARRRRKVDE